jgi:hypothetical protein
LVIKGEEEKVDRVTVFGILLKRRGLEILQRITWHFDFTLRVEVSQDFDVVFAMSL